MRISCIICAWNEAPRIGAVLAVVSTHPLLDEVIVVDDGSIDGTSEVVRSFPNVRSIRLDTNRGKSHAMAVGVAAAKHDLLMLLDADLKGLDAGDVTRLAEPVLSERAEVSMSLRRNSLLVYRVLGLDFVSGERVLPRELLSEALAEMRRLPRFGLEVFANARIIAGKLSIAVVRWPHVTQARKREKMGWWRGTRSEFRMVLDVLQVALPLAAITQTYRMHSLRIRDDRCSTLMDLRDRRDA
jgi:glycosyltransferase involved in cell wall biosynthesis